MSAHSLGVAVMKTTVFPAWRFQIPFATFVLFAISIRGYSSVNHYNFMVLRHQNVWSDSHQTTWKIGQWLYIFKITAMLQQKLS